MPRGESITLSQTLVFTVCLGACGWLFKTVVDTYGAGLSSAAEITTLTSRVAALESKGCGRGN